MLKKWSCISLIVIVSISSCFSTVDLASSSSSTGLPTFIDVYYQSSPNDQEVVFNSGDVITFHVEVRNVNGSIINSGVIDAVDINNQSNFNDQKIIVPGNQNTTFQKTVTSQDTGVHLFCFSYSDPSSIYESSVVYTRTVFNFDNFYTDNDTQETNLALLSSSEDYSIGDNQSTITQLSTTSASFPYFMLEEDSYLFFISTEFNDSRYVLETSTSNQTGVISSFQVNLGLYIPLFFVPCSQQFSFRFTGSASSHLNRSHVNVTATVTYPTTAIELHFLNGNIIERAGFSDTGTGVNLSCTISNYQDDLTASFDMLNIDGSYEITIIDSFTVTEQQFDINLVLSISEFGFNYLYLGEHQIVCRLFNASGIEVTNSAVTFVLVDDTTIEDVSITDNPCKPDDEVNIQFVAKNEDDGNPVQSDFVVQLGNSTLEGATDAFGLGVIDTLAPSIPGSFPLNISIMPDLSVYSYSSSVIVPFTVVADSNILIVNSEIAGRDNETLISASVFGEADEQVTDGDISFFHLHDNGSLSLLYSGKVPDIDFSWRIPTYFPVGYQNFLCLYENSTVHSSSQQVFSIKILSKPVIDILAINSSLKIGTNTTITGTVKDENNIPISHSRVTINHYFKIDDTVEQWVVETDEEGHFSIEFSANDSSDLGLHSIESCFIPVDSVDNYYVRSDSITLSIIVWSELSLLVMNTIVAGEIVNFQINGNDGQFVDLSYISQGNEHIIASSLQLEASGSLDYFWIVPVHLQGRIDVVICDTDDNDNYYVQFVEVLVRPVANVYVSTSVIVNEPFSYTVNSTHDFNLSIDSVPIYLNQPSSNQFTRSYTFSIPRTYDLVLSIEGRWLVTTEISIPITAYLEINTSINVQEIDNKTAISVFVKDSFGNTISSSVVRIYLHDSGENSLELLGMASGSTGQVTFNLYLERGLNLIVVETQAGNPYQTRSDEINITISESPVITITSDSTFTLSPPYMIEGRITIKEQPVSTSFRYECIDSSSELVFSGSSTSDAAGFFIFSTQEELLAGEYFLYLCIDKNESVFLDSAEKYFEFLLINSTRPAINVLDLEETGNHFFTIKFNITRSTELVSVKLYVYDDANGTNNKVYDVEDIIFDSGVFWDYFEITFELQNGQYSIFIVAEDIDGLTGRSEKNVEVTINSNQNHNSTISDSTVPVNSNGNSDNGSNEFLLLLAVVFGSTTIGVGVSTGIILLSKRKKVKEILGV